MAPCQAAAPPTTQTGTATTPRPSFFPPNLPHARKRLSQALPLPFLSLSSARLHEGRLLRPGAVQPRLLACAAADAHHARGAHARVRLEVGEVHSGPVALHSRERQQRRQGLRRMLQGSAWQGRRCTRWPSCPAARRNCNGGMVRRDATDRFGCSAWPGRRAARLRVGRPPAPAPALPLPQRAAASPCFSEQQTHLGCFFGGVLAAVKLQLCPFACNTHTHKKQQLLGSIRHVVETLSVVS